MYPCVYFSCKLTPAEANYDVGNRELLLIKAALEEWWHWLEGALHPFTVLIGHRNLEYLWKVKRSNPRQAQWALLFTHFQFTVTYWPGTKDAKTDAFSHWYDLISAPSNLEPILPSTMVLTPISWEFEEEIRQAQNNEPPSSTCPPTKLFVPASLCLQVIPWAHEVSDAPQPWSATDSGSPHQPKMWRNMWAPAAPAPSLEPADSSILVY